MSHSFSTDQVPVSDRLDAWQYNASQICGNCRFQFPKRCSFRGSIERRQLAGLELTIEKGLPLSAGLGGSAASAVAGAVAADAVLDSHLGRMDLLAAALEAEAVVSGRHPDNAAPSLLGGAVLVVSLEPLHVAPLRVHPELVLALVTPAYAVETARARAVLPAQVPRADAVRQAARLAALVAGLERGDADLIRRAMVDAIAEVDGLGARVVS